MKLPLFSFLSNHHPTHYAAGCLALVRAAEGTVDDAGHALAKGDGKVVDGRQRPTNLCRRRLGNVPLLEGKGN